MVIERQVEAPTERPLILVTNDDGVLEPGLEAVVSALGELGEVAVIAPDRNCSGMSHRISLLQPLRATELRSGWWQVDGSPADCVYLGVNALLPRKPNLVVSGINAGPNLSFDVHYSGTVGGAMEGTLLGIPSIAASLTDPRGGSFDFAARFTARLAARVLAEGLPSNTTLNVNVPSGSPERFQLTFLGHRLFRHSVSRREDPRGISYFWIGGEPDQHRAIPGSDCDAVAAGVISVTPLSVDLTQRQALTTHVADLEIPGVERVEAPEPIDELEFFPPQ